MIEFHDVHKSFGSLDVLKGINLKIEKSQVVTLIGPSGSGKSTILRCMNLLERPTSGQVLIEGQDITAPKTDIQKIRKDIGMVFQHFNLFPHMTVMENMVYAPIRVNKMPKDQAKEKAGRPDREGRRVSGQAFRRTEATYSHRAGAGHGAEDYAVR